MRRNKIGLLGGSFNPAHAGHAYISENALSSLKLDEVWWLVSPLNPFKDEKDMQPLPQRLAYAKHFNANPAVKVTDLEREIGTRYTVDTLEYLTEKYHDTDFVWLMGDDLLPEFHLWKDWQRILALADVAVFPRVMTERELESIPAVRLMKENGKWHYINIPPYHLSASEIRPSNNNNNNTIIKDLDNDKNR